LGKFEFSKQNTKKNKIKYWPSMIVATGEAVIGRITVRG
jgi:hypothetical protein